MTDTEDPTTKYHLRHITVPHCGNCRFYDEGEFPEDSGQCLNDLMRSGDGMTAFPNCDYVCDLYDSRTRKHEVVIGLSRDQFNRMDAAMKEYLMRGYDLKPAQEASHDSSPFITTNKENKQ